MQIKPFGYSLRCEYITRCFVQINWVHIEIDKYETRYDDTDRIQEYLNIIWSALKSTQQ